MCPSVREAQSPQLDIGKALHGLFNEVRSGTAHLSAAVSVAKASKTHPILMNVSPGFFTLTTYAHLEAAQLCAARLFDTHDDSAGIPWLLKQAKHRGEEFNPRTDGELDEAIKEAERVCVEKTPVLTAVKHRRDRSLAHLDKKTIRDPEQFQEDARLTYPELEDLFASATDILNKMADLYGTAGFVVDGSDYDDFPRVLDLIEKGVQANAKELELRIGPVP